MYIVAAYNEHGPRNADFAKDLVNRVTAAFPGENVIVSYASVPLAGNHDTAWIEVPINFMRTNANEANALVERLTAAGFEARTVYNDD